MANGQSRVRADIAAAAPAKAPSRSGSPGTPPSPPPPPQPPQYLRDGFSVDDYGVWKDRGEKPRLWICNPLRPIAETEDDDGYFGVVWQWQDRNGRVRQEVFGRELFAGEAGQVSSAMAARGLTLNGTREAKQAFGEYTNIASTTARARVVYRTGWHEVGGKRIYVLPDQIFGSPPMPVILQAGSRESNLFQQGGTVAQWRDTVGAFCIGNSRLGLAVSMGFAAGLVYLVAEDGGGVNLFGDSRSGKTTCGLASASVCGGDPADGGARAFVRTWRATSNSTEAIATLHSDIGLVMDELGQSDAREVGPCQYMLSGGQGKTRLDRGSTLRSVLRFRVFYLSTGEVTLASKMAEAGVKVKAGQGVRLVDVPADEGKGLGAFADIHDAESPGGFAQLIKEATSKYFGTPFRVFISEIVAKIERDPDYCQWLRDEMDRITRHWLSDFGTHGGQVRSVARRFALIALAGNLATDFGLTGWGVGDDGDREAEWAAHTCFNAWLRARGTTGSHEDAQAVVQLRKFVSEHGGSRFDDWGEKVLAEGQQPDLNAPPPMQKFRTVNRAGWRRYIGPEGGDEGGGQWHYFFTADGMHEALAGLTYNTALKVLVARKMVLPGPGAEIARSLSVPGAGKQRLYQVPSSVMSAAVDASLDPEG